MSDDRHVEMLDAAESLIKFHNHMLFTITHVFAIRAKRYDNFVIPQVLIECSGHDQRMWAPLEGPHNVASNPLVRAFVKKAFAAPPL